MSFSISDLTKTQVWVETEKALKSGKFWDYIEMLDSIGYLETYLPTLVLAKDLNEPTAHHPEPSLWEHIRLVIKQTEMAGGSAQEVFASLLHDTGKPVCYQETGKAHGHDSVGAGLNEDWCREWGVPDEYRELAVMVAKYHGKVHGVLGRGKNKASRPKSIMKLLTETGAEENQERFTKLVNCCAYDAKGRGGEMWGRDYPQREYLLECLTAVLAVDTKSVTKALTDAGKEGIVFDETIRIAKIDAIREVMKRKEI